MFSMYVNFLCIGLAVTKVTAQYLFQKSALKYNLGYNIIGVVCYALFGYMLKEIIRVTNSLTMSAIVSTLSNVILILVGRFVFQQKLSLTQWAGVVAVIIGSYFAT